MTSTVRTRWFAGPDTRPDALAMLFCLPYAGAGASAFRGWARALAPAVEVLAVQLPGREWRVGEPPAVDPGAVAGAIAAAVAERDGRPYALYGHSLGARIAFEATRELRRAGLPLPARLYVGGARPPDAPPAARLDGLSLLTDAELIEQLVAAGSLPPEVRTQPDLRELLLPVLRADFGWLDRYRYRPQPPLPVPIVAFAGTSDPVASAADMAGWARHTGAGLTMHELDGGHLFLHPQQQPLIDLIRADLLAAAPARPGRGHCVPLGPAGWAVWRDAVLRTAGFPADGLTCFASPSAAAAADACLDAAAAGAGPEAAASERLEQVLGGQWQEGLDRAAEIARQPRFREAVTWQNPSALAALDGLAAPPDRDRTHAERKKRRERARLVARYWQRYCGKNETIGFFGPAAWVTLDPDGPPVTLTHGRNWLRERRVHLEHWALTALADRLAADPAIRPWLPVTLAPQLTVERGRVLRPAQPPAPLSPAEAAAVRLCDGRPAARVAAEITGGAVRNEADGYLLLDRLADRGIITWGASLPQHPGAEDALRQQIAAIGHDDARERAAAALDRLAAARDRVAAAAGDPEALLAALQALDEEFTGLTGLPPRRRPGQMYAGRALCYEDTSRDVDIVLGGAVLDALAGPMAALLPAARWLTVALAGAYSAALRGLFDELAGDTGQVPLSDLWYLAQGPLFGSGERPADRVSAEFAARWDALFGLGRAAGTARLSFGSAELAALAAQAFPARRPGFAAGRLHSPDVHICAADPGALRAGEFFLVLGEMHVAWPTFDTAVFTWAHPDPGRLRDALAADLGGHRIRLLYPADWPRHTARIAHSLDHPTDRQLGFAAAPGADPARVLPATAVTVARHGDHLVATAPDGHRWPLIEVFAPLVSMHAVDGFKLAGTAAAHTPRITVDRLVVTRETWRTTVAQTGLAEARGEQARFLAARRLRRDLGLPDRVFVKLGTETKPVFADLTSPLLVSSLCSMMQRARANGGGQAAVTFTELLPGPEHAWLTDASGQRYFSELRLQMRDPQPGGPS